VDETGKIFLGGANFGLRSIRATLAVVVAAFEHGHCRDKSLIFPDLLHIASLYGRSGAYNRVVFFPKSANEGIWGFHSPPMPAYRSLKQGDEG
jgi:hypothetical protein